MAKKGRDHHLHAGLWSSEKSRDSARPGTHRDHLHEGVGSRGLCWDLFPHFLEIIFWFFFVKLPLPSSVHHTLVGLTPSPGSKGEEQVGWAWPMRAFHFLVYSDGSGMAMWPELIHTMNPENFFFQNFLKLGPFFSLELLSWLAINLELMVTSLANEVMRSGEGDFCWEWSKHVKRSQEMEIILMAFWFPRSLLPKADRLLDVLTAHKTNSSSCLF